MTSMLSPVYSPWGLAVERAEGMKVYTDRGVFLDAFSGIGVLPLGHSHPDVVRAVAEKAARFTHLSNYFLDPDAVTVAEQLVAMTGRPGEVYFSNSGAEANEAALKAVKKHRKGVIVSFEGNFHGRTLGALSVTWGPSMRKPFEPLVPGCVFLPLRGSMLLDFAEEYDVAAVFLECVQGNSGVIPIPGGLADAVKVLQRNKGVLVVADEIQAGLGRTGKYFSHEHWGLAPDIITIGKGIGGGLPLGAALFCGWSPFGSGDHGSTFAPNPVSLAAGKAVLSHLTPEFVGEVARKGERFRRRLSELSWAGEVRGKGLMIGVVTDDAAGVKRRAFENGVLLNVAGGAVRFLPSLAATDAELDDLADRLNF
jgi:acetylornithine/succinyldiaminopimelate/putrescine aminotransferase